MSGIVATFKENNLPYHLFQSKSWDTKLHGYFYEPSGWQIQLNDVYAVAVVYADLPSGVEEWSGSKVVHHQLPMRPAERPLRSNRGCPPACAHATTARALTSTH